MMTLENIIKAIVTPFVFVLAAVFCVLHFFVGTIVYLWLVFRSVMMYSVAVVQSAYKNQDVAAQYLVLITTLCTNYLQLYVQFSRMVSYIWLPKEHSVTFDIKRILEQERSLLTKNFSINIVLILALTISFYSWTFGLGSMIVDAAASLIGSPGEEGVLEGVDPSGMGTDSLAR